ncbi:Exonuclease SbcC [Ectopseudomonas oleovorans]|uniref:Uncharacterized protein n=1 Tax=Ectopseudomonas oleovorans TaxID=301 RepID=A0A653B8G5_ECTOL|nr:Exonuclease SbcC [Pseudomonas oleovorans]
MHLRPRRRLRRPCAGTAHQGAAHPHRADRTQTEPAELRLSKPRRVVIPAQEGVTTAVADCCSGVITL